MIKIDSTLQKKCPDIKLGILLFNIQPKSEYPELLELIAVGSKELAAAKVMEDISKTPAIAAGRKTYKAVGKDPARYRLSAEALARRVISGKGLYQINNVVDALNFVSLKSGISIGGYDADKINGDIQMGIGTAEEPYEAIGRGNLNMEFMPLLRDESGAFGSPTSDSTRTMVSKDMQHFLMVFFGFGGMDGLEDGMNDAVDLMGRFGGGELVRQIVV